MMSAVRHRRLRHAGTETVKGSIKVTVIKISRRVIEVDNPLDNCYNETGNEPPIERYDNE